MRTNIDLDDEQITKAIKLTGLKTKREVVTEALRFLIEQLERKSLLELRGKIKFSDGYNYKSLRK